MRKKVYSIVCVFAASLLLLLCSCSQQPAPTPAPTSSPSAQETTAPTPESGVVIDSPLVGQWVPIGVNGKGYMSFLADGTMAVSYTHLPPYLRFYLFLFVNHIACLYCNNFT